MNSIGNFIKDKRVILAACLGNVFVWYDFALYGYLAVVLAKLFFPSGDTLASLIYTFGVFAAGFIMRPVGAAFFGHIGDKYGRKKALLISIFLMAIPTVLVCLLPAYSQIGVFASLLLIFIRILQGFSIGGEFTGSISYLVEVSPERSKGLYGSLTYFSTFVGSLIASLVIGFTTMMPENILYSYGWRFPFLLGLVLVVIGIFLRTNMEETEIFLSLKDSKKIHKSPLKETFCKHYKELIMVVGVTLAPSALTYMIFIYMVTYASAMTEISLPNALMINTFCMLLLIILIPVFGYLSDMYNRLIIITAGVGGVLLFSYPLFLLIHSGSMQNYIIAQILFTVLVSVILGVLPTVLVEILPPEIRMSALSIGYNITHAIFGGTTPLISTLLIKYTGLVVSPSFYLIACSLFSVAVYIFILKSGLKKANNKKAIL